MFLFVCVTEGVGSSYLESFLRLSARVCVSVWSWFTHIMYLASVLNAKHPCRWETSHCVVGIHFTCLRVCVCVGVSTLVVRLLMRSYRHVQGFWSLPVCVMYVCLALLSAAVSKCTNWIKSNCDVFKQLLTPVVQVGKAISLSIRFTLVDTQKNKAKEWKRENRKPAR